VANFLQKLGELGLVGDPGISWIQVGGFTGPEGACPSSVPSSPGANRTSFDAARDK